MEQIPNIYLYDINAIYAKVCGCVCVRARNSVINATFSRGNKIDSRSRNYTVI